MAVKSGLYDESGRPEVNDEICTACGACARTCPAEVLRLEGKRIRVDTTAGFGCIACAHCMMVCPSGSIRVSGRGLSYADLLDLPRPETHATPEQLAALFQARRSVRHFTPQEPDRAVLERVLEAAATAPTGIPPSDVSVAVVVGRDKVRRLAGQVIAGHQILFLLAGMAMNGGKKATFFQKIGKFPRIAFTSCDSTVNNGSTMPAL